MSTITGLIGSFIKRYNISTHTIVVAFGFFTGYLAVNDQARQAFGTFLSHHSFQSMAYGFIVFMVSAYKGSHTIDAQAANVAKAQQQAKEMQVDLSHDN